MKTFAIVVGIFLLTNTSSPATPLPLHPDVSEILNIVANISPVWDEFSHQAEKIQVYDVIKNEKSATLTEYTIKAYKIVQGDIIQGKIDLIIRRLREGNNPEDYFYRYETYIIHR